jgi:hypothetical protein
LDRLRSLVGWEQFTVSEVNRDGTMEEHALNTYTHTHIHTYTQIHDTHARTQTHTYIYIYVYAYIL